MKQNKTIVIGLTGNSGSGKSVVSSILADEGVKIIDADKVAREVIMPNGSAYGEVLNLFGSKVLLPDGSFNRKKIAEIVFNNKELLKKHTEITHKYIIKIMLNMLNEYKALKAEAVVLDAPLLIEANLHGECDYVWLVSSGFNTKVSRITERDGLTEEQARRRILSQSKQEDLMKYSDFIIFNDGSYKELKETVISEFKRIMVI